jgi:secondary thiamine-phosphate synthase enzyme
MGVYGDVFDIRTKGENDILDVSGDVAKVIADSGIKDGLACVFVSGSTGAITTLEFEPGLLLDLPTAMERLVPKGLVYEHHLRWHDGNGHSHVRASLMGPSLTVPFKNGNLLLGTWQQIIFVEMDVHSRNRQIHVQVMGE